MDADYISRMDNEDVRLEPVEDYEAQTGRNGSSGYRTRTISDSFEPLEVSSSHLLFVIITGLICY